MKVFYRISDNSYQKPKLIGSSKRVCLENFISVFGKDFVLIADNCKEETLAWLAPHTTVMTKLGNAGSLLYAIKLAIQAVAADELVYFVEDDYLHLPKAPQLLNEGVSKSDYVTLYDHPDKYTPMYENGEVSKVIKTKSSHWRYTVSTCMTFGTTAKVLEEDFDIWNTGVFDNHPNDHEIFTKLKEKGRRLIVPIPGAACHTDMTVSWQNGNVMIEPWAIEMMCQEKKRYITTGWPKFADRLEQLTKDKQGWELLTMLDAIEFNLPVNTNKNRPG